MKAYTTISTLQDIQQRGQQQDRRDQQLPLRKRPFTLHQRVDRQTGQQPQDIHRAITLSPPRCTHSTLTDRQHPPH